LLINPQQTFSTFFIIIIFCCWGTGVRTQGLTIAKQALLLLEPLCQTIIFVLFFQDFQADPKNHMEMQRIQDSKGNVKI
jgi:hypothetical protein